METKSCRSFSSSHRCRHAETKNRERRVVAHLHVLACQYGWSEVQRHHVTGRVTWLTVQKFGSFGRLFKRNRSSRSCSLYRAVNPILPALEDPSPPPAFSTELNIPYWPGNTSGTFLNLISALNPSGSGAQARMRHCTRRQPVGSAVVAQSISCDTRHLKTIGSQHHLWH